MAERRDDLEGPEVVGPVARGIAGMSTFVSMGRAGEGCERGGGMRAHLARTGFSTCENSRQLKTPPGFNTRSGEDKRGQHIFCVQHEPRS